MNGGVVLVNTSLMAVGSNVSDPQRWNGGQASIVVAGLILAPILNVVLVGVGAQNRTLKANSGIITAEGLYGPYYLPAGNYAVHSATGSSSGLFVGLFPTP